MGNFQVGGGVVDGHGWHESVPGAQVEKRLIAVERWLPAPDDGPSSDDGVAPVREQLAELYMESGCCEDLAREFAAGLLARHARELAALLEERPPGAARDLNGYAHGLGQAAQ